jgi:hypothetical protein
MKPIIYPKAIHTKRKQRTNEPKKQTERKEEKKRNRRTGQGSSPGVLGARKLCAEIRRGRKSDKRNGEGPMISMMQLEGNANRQRRRCK